MLGSYPGWIGVVDQEIKIPHSSTAEFPRGFSGNTDVTCSHLNVKMKAAEVPTTIGFKTIQ